MVRYAFNHKPANWSKEPERTASAKEGLFCFKLANWSGFANSISRSMLGSLTPDIYLLAFWGTWMELKSKFETDDDDDENAFPL